MTRAAVCALVAGALAAAALVELAKAPPARRRRATALRRPLLAALTRLGRTLGAPAAPHALERRIALAGSPFGLTPRDAMALKAGAALVAGLLAAPLAAGASPRHAFALLAGVPAAAFFAPDLWLRRRAQGRRAALARELPDVLDLLRVAVEAGLPVSRALAEVGRRHAGVLAHELRTTANAIELGVPRQGALAALALRAPLPAVQALIAAIGRSERHGAPLSHSLTALAAQARADQGRAMTEHAARAAPKIQLVVALLLVPAAMLVVAAGAVAGLSG
jgi:tight adherence protein C